jgi:hypothetical protein
MSKYCLLQEMDLRSRLHHGDTKVKNSSIRCSVSINTCTLGFYFKIVRILVIYPARFGL